ncbi:hypothetical protein [Acinetobacter lwoffii]|uniref:hypothetical protein n=1 Tax=Acinetobacter lwoffii TaxID=28090 RepID=UPI0002CDC8BF|nr:hypothetical protein [Acinetobacter lwoffii]ENU64200.1 hypothetical protein F980_00056 [Acinetobacter lwoffii NIPH 715]
MSDNSEIIDLLTAIVSTIETSDTKAQTAKSELLEQLKVIASKTDTISTNFPKLIETLSNFDSKIASSFDDIQNVSKQLNSVVEKVTIAEQAILNVQQQAQKLKLDSTLNAINEADERAQQLNRHLNSSSTKYAENMSATTNIALEQINKLKSEVSTIADSFSKIVSDQIADSVTSKVSKTLADKLLNELDNKIEHVSSKTAERFTASALEKIKPQITAFSDNLAKSNKQYLQRFNANRDEVLEASETSNKLYLERENAYQAHVSKEKSTKKRNWIVIFLVAWFGFTATAVGIAYAVKNASESTVNEALGYIKLKDALNNFGFHPENSDYCQSMLPKKQFELTAGPKVSSCFYLESPTYEYTVNSRNLMIFTK